MQQQQRFSFRAFAASVMRDPAGGATAQSRWAVLEAELIDYSIVVLHNMLPVVQ